MQTFNFEAIFLNYIFLPASFLMFFDTLSLGLVLISTLSNLDNVLVPVAPVLTLPEPLKHRGGR